MKRIRLTALRILPAILVALGAGYWILSDRESDPGEAEQEIAAERPGQGSPGEPAPPPEEAPPQSPDTGSTLRERLREAVQAMVLSRLSPGELTALYELTRDGTIREHLLRLDPMPAAVAAVLALTETDAGEQLELARKWIAADPENAAGYIVAAGTLPADAGEERLREFLDPLMRSKAVDLYDSARRVEMSDAVRFLGPDGESMNAGAIQEAAAEADLSMLRLASKVTGTLKSASGESLDSASYGVAVAHSLSRMQGLPANYAMIALGMEAAILKEVDPETEYGSSGQTVGGRLADIRSTGSSLMSDLERAMAAYETSPEEIRKSFDRRSEVYGAPAAARWLLDQTENR